MTPNERRERVAEAIGRIPAAYRYSDTGFPKCYEDVLFVVTYGDKGEAFEALRPVVECMDTDTLRAMHGEFVGVDTYRAARARSLLDFAIQHTISNLAKIHAQHTAEVPA